MTPTWVHFDRRRGPAACGAGYPLIRQGARGSYVLIAQDLLNTLGFTTRGLDGMFGPNTANATMAFQRRFGLVPDGVIGCNTWRALTTRGVGIGRTRTTIDLSRKLSCILGRRVFVSYYTQHSYNTVRHPKRTPENYERDEIYYETIKI